MQNWTMQDMLDNSNDVFLKSFEAKLSSSKQDVHSSNVRES